MNALRRCSKPTAALCLGTLILTAQSAAARSITDSWPLLGFARDRACELTIIGNGKTMQIAATGLLPGERARFRLSNAGMKPIDWRVLANRNGAWSQHYIPFLWHHQGGTVSVSLEGSTCRLTASAPWAREIRVIS
jgi:hypothetical protein